MHISHLRIENFRNLENQEVYFDAKINLITGQNGAGKTSLLEAIYYLGRGKSFRTNKYKNITQYKKNYFRVIAKTQKPDHQIGIEKNNDNSVKIRIDKETKSISSLAYIVPSIAIASHSFSMIDAGPSYRRSFMDYGTFHCDKGFHQSWAYYQRALKSRNAALKKKMDKRIVESFTPSLADYGEKIHESRKAYFKSIKPLLLNHLQKMDFPYAVTIKYNAGWNVSQGLQDSLLKNIDNDYRLAHTVYGPHRADIRFATDKGNVANFLSRGQQKSLILALHLAQIDLIKSRNDFSPILIIDDISSELDAVKRNHIFDYLVQLDCQMFFSTTEESFFNKKIRSQANIIRLNAGKII